MTTHGPAESWEICLTCNNVVAEYDEGTCDCNYSTVKDAQRVVVVRQPEALQEEGS